jgi:hypothetical protein
MLAKALLEASSHKEVTKEEKLFHTTPTKKFTTPITTTSFAGDTLSPTPPGGGLFGENRCAHLRVWRMPRWNSQRQSPACNGQK